MITVNKRAFTQMAVVLGLSLSAYAAEKVTVKIIDRKDSSTRYTYVLPGYSNSSTNAGVNCVGTVIGANCAGSATTTGSSIPARVGTYDVQGATFALQLPSGRVAVVNCQSKYKLKFDHANRRSCRVPLVDNIQAEFKGDEAKLWWPVSIDGKKLQSETYKILAVLEPSPAK